MKMAIRQRMTANADISPLKSRRVVDQTNPQMHALDRVRLKEVFTLAGMESDGIGVFRVAVVYKSYRVIERNDIVRFKRVLGRSIKVAEVE